MRIEPPPSVPSASGPQPLATPTAAPPLEPPGVSAGFHGLRVTPKSGFSVTALRPNSDVLVFPRTSAPAARRRATAIASSSGTWSAKSREPPVVVSPRVKRTSLIETGTPWSGPSGSSFVTAISASRAAARTCSAATTQNAFSTGLIASIRDRTASVTSIGESFLARTRPEISMADCQISIDCSHCIIPRRAVLRSSRPPRERARLGQRRLARARTGAAPRRHVARDRTPRDDGGPVGARGSPVARGTISGRRRPAGRAPHRLRSARLGAHRSHPTARRTHALAARWRHRRAESDRRARARAGRGPPRLPGPLPHRAALRGAPRVVPLRARGRDRSARRVHGRRARMDARAPRARSEEHTSELQSLAYLVCRLLLEKKKNQRVTAERQ